MTVGEGILWGVGVLGAVWLLTVVISLYGLKAAADKMNELDDNVAKAKRKITVYPPSTGSQFTGERKAQPPHTTWAEIKRRRGL